MERRINLYAENTRYLEMKRKINSKTSFASRRQARIATRAGVHVSLFFRDCAHTAGYTRQGPRRKGGDPPTPPQLTLPTRTSPRPVGLPTAARENPSPEATEAPLWQPNTT